MSASRTSNLKYVAIALFAVVNSISAYGQDDWSEPGEIENAEVIIEKDRQIELPNAARPFSKIPPANINQSTLPQAYDFNEYLLSGSVYEPNLKAKIISIDENQKYLKNYVKGGLGNYAAALGEASLNTSNKNFAAGLLFKHKSFAKGPIDGSNSAASNTEASLYARMAQKKSVLSAQLGFESVLRNHYGYAEMPVNSDDLIRQVYNTFDIDLGLKNIEENAAFDYDSEISFYRLADNFDASESGFEIDLKTKTRIDKNISIRLDGTGLLSSYEDAVSQSRNLLRVLSGIEYNIGQISILGAARIAVTNEDAVNASKFRIYPHVVASYDIDDSWNVTGGLRGDLETVTLRSLSSENQYLNSNLPIFHSNKEIEIFASVQGSASQSVGLNAGFSFANYKNQYFYANSFRDSTKFDLIYESERTDILNLFASTSISPIEAFQVIARLDYYNYSTKSITGPLHRPDYSLSISASYQLNQKFLAGLEASFTGGIEGLNLESGTSRKLQSINDLNVNFEYTLNRNLGAFLQFNNVLSQDYERYLNYRNRGIVVLAGVRYSF